MSALLSLLRQVGEQRRIPPHAVAYARGRIGRPLLRVGRRARRLVPDCGYLAARRAVAGAAGGRRPGAAVVYADGAWQVAVDWRHTSVRQVATDNLAAVARLLGGASVPFFVRDASRPGPVTVGVADEDRGRVLGVLAHAAPHDRRNAYRYARDARGGRPVLLRNLASARLAGAERLLVYRNHRVSDEYVVGASHACVIEFWCRAGGNLRPPADAAPGRLVVDEAAPAETLVGERRYPTLSTFADHRSLADPPFPVDVVYTWVDDSDPRWRRRFEEERARRDGVPRHAEAANASRYRSHDELRYSLRSLAMYADFVRHVYIVTAGQVPGWLDADHPRITLVDHVEILPADWLPTFNSHAIEARLHHIDGLAEHYLYLNDDFLFGREVAATTFFTPNGLPKVFVDEEAPIPAGPSCPDDRPVDSAAKNVRDVLREHLGVRVGRKLLHVPYPQRRSLLAEAEERFSAEFGRTAGSRFRGHSDLSIASCFSHYYAFATARAVPGEISAEYVNIAFRWAPLQLARLLDRRDRDAFCLNETDVPPDRADAVHETVARFLRSYLPAPSPYEVPAGAGQPPSRKYETMS